MYNFLLCQIYRAFFDKAAGKSEWKLRYLSACHTVFYVISPARDNGSHAGETMFIIILYSAKL